MAGFNFTKVREPRLRLPDRNMEEISDVLKKLFDEGAKYVSFGTLITEYLKELNGVTDEDTVANLIGVVHDNYGEFIGRVEAVSKHSILAVDVENRPVHESGGQPAGFGL